MKHARLRAAHGSSAGPVRDIAMGQVVAELLIMAKWPGCVAWRWPSYGLTCALPAAAPAGTCMAEQGSREERAAPKTEGARR